MWDASPNSQKVIFALVLTLLVGSGIASYVMADRYAARQDLVVHTYQLVSLIHDTAAKLEAAENAARKAQEHGVKKVDVFVKGPGSGRETAIRSLQAAGLEVGAISGVTPQPHNGVRPPKRRRV